MVTWSEIINEAVAYRGRGFSVISNPTKTQFTTMLTRLKDGGDTVRGLLDAGGTIYLWDAYFAEHQQISEALGLIMGEGERDALNFECSAAAVTFNYAENDAGSAEEMRLVAQLVNAPALQRLYGKPVPVTVEHW
jgi:hypothetical protein